MQTLRRRTTAAAAAAAVARPFLVHCYLSPSLLSSPLVPRQPSKSYPLLPSSFSHTPIQCWAFPPVMHLNPGHCFLNPRPRVTLSMLPASPLLSRGPEVRDLRPEGREPREVAGGRHWLRFLSDSLYTVSLLPPSLSPFRPWARAAAQ